MNAVESNVTELSNGVVSSGAEADGNQFLTFLLAGEEYGVDILRVQEIKGWDSVTPIPNTPDYIRGVINLRGTIVPIVDLRCRFGLEAIEYGPMTVVIVLKVFDGDDSRVMGVVVDAVSDVYNVQEDALKSAPDFGDVVDVAFVQGLATVGEVMVIILDIDKLLNSDELVVMGDAGSGA
jgi:purine-binding chemotaxis protein CheW